MSKRNYTQYSKKPVEEPKPVEVKKPVEEPKPVEVKKPEPQLVQETVETVILPELVDGVVVGCAKLNVRAEPSIAADVVCVLDAMAELEVDVTNSNNEWVKVITAIGVEGYCMRKFIDVHL